jgi:glycerophosphoryl diester phosphodiesterase
MNRFRLPCVTGLALAVWAGGCSPQPAATPASPKLPLIIAHRGASGHAPENTLAAFRLAWEQGADGIEGDFHLTRDGHIVCLHDADTKRTAAGGVMKNVREASLDELRGLDVGSWKDPAFREERIPTLAEVMSVVPAGKMLFLEVKCGPEIVPPLLAALEAGPLGKEQVTVISFNETVVRQFKSVAPEWRASWLVDIQPDAGGAPQPPAITLLDALGRLAAEATGLQADETLDARYFAELKAGGFERHVWTVNSPAAARRFVAFGVDSITTDVPGALRQALLTGVD